MMTTKRRLLAYAKQTTRANFTPAQRRRMVSKARQAAGHVHKGWTIQDQLDAVALREAAKQPEHLQDIVTLIMVSEPS